MTTKSKSSATPWVEKYRPQSLQEVSHQREVVSTLQNAVKTNRLPHLLLYGPPGTGKTSVALALCHTLWDPVQAKKRILELNASDERGISVVRDKIKHFAGLAVSQDGSGSSSSMMSEGSSSLTKRGFVQTRIVPLSKQDDQSKESGGVTMDTAEGGEDDGKKKYPNPPFKVIILDEADTVTPDAQAALRRVIEAHSRITRFILICNYVTRIIEPLASRCAKFRFQALPPLSMKYRLTSIANAEGCRFSYPTLRDDNDDDGNDNNTNNDHDKQRDEVLNEILELSHGDMRRAITMLQSAHFLSGKSADGDAGIIQKDAIAEMVGLPPTNVVKDILAIVTNPSSTFQQMETSMEDTMMEGYAAQDIMKELWREVVIMDSKQLGDLHKANIAIKMAQVDKNLIDGADELLQLITVGSLILRCFQNPQ